MRVDTYRQGRAFWIGAAVMLILFLAVQAATLDLRRWDRDEGMTLALAQSEHAGFRLYRDVFSDVSPLFVAMLHLSIDLFGAKLVVGRAVVLALAALTLLASGLLAREMGGPVSGLAAILLLGLSPGFRSAAQFIWADIPGSGLAILAVLLVLTYGRLGGTQRLVGAGVLAGAAVLTKVLLAFTIVPLTLALWAGAKNHHTWREWFAALSILAAASALLPLLALAYYGPAIVHDLLIFSTQAQEVFSVDVQAQLSTAIAYLGLDPGLLLLAATGLLLHRRPRQALLPFTWFAVGLAFLVTRAPYWAHQTTSLLPPLAVAAGLAAADVVQILRLPRPEWHLRQSATLTFVALSVLVWTVNLPRAWRFGNPGYSSTLDNGVAELVQRLAERTAPEDYVIADDLGIPFLAGRISPPELALTSYKRIAAGYLTGDDLIHYTLKYGVSAVVLGPDNYRGAFPEYLGWLEQNYVLDDQTPGGYRLFLARDWNQRMVAIPPVDFDGQITLLGYSLSPDRLSPGTPMHLVLYWKAKTATTKPLTVFVHLLDARGQSVAGADSPPLAGRYPTTTWKPRQRLRDPRDFVAPASVQPGEEYTLEVGLYDPQALGRPVTRYEGGELIPDAAVRLATLRVEAVPSPTP